MLYAKYMMPKNHMNAQPSSLTLNARYTTTDVLRMPMTSHGLYLPQRVLVRSMMLPMSGSFRASKTLAPIMMPVIAISWAGVRLWVKST